MSISSAMGARKKGMRNAVRETLRTGTMTSMLEKKRR
jgi:hypothetical protein